MRKCENPLIVLDSEVTAELQFSADIAKAGGEYLLQSGRVCEGWIKQTCPRPFKYILMMTNAKYQLWLLLESLSLYHLKRIKLIEPSIR